MIVWRMGKMECEGTGKMECEDGEDGMEDVEGGV